MKTSPNILDTLNGKKNIIIIGDYLEDIENLYSMIPNRNIDYIDIRFPEYGLSPKLASIKFEKTLSQICEKIGVIILTQSIYIPSTINTLIEESKVNNNRFKYSDTILLHIDEYKDIKILNDDETTMLDLSIYDEISVELNDRFDRVYDQYPKKQERRNNMTRPIKFRGMRADGGGMVYGDLVHIEEEESKQISFILDWSIEPYKHEIDPFTLGQYTGLTDTNGKEIYEGDICHFNWNPFFNKPSEIFDFELPVMFYDGWGCWCFHLQSNKMKKAQRELFTDYSTEELYVAIGSPIMYGNGVKVIGSIHTNPEMI